MPSKRPPPELQTGDRRPIHRTGPDKDSPTTSTGAYRTHTPQLRPGISMPAGPTG